MIEFDLPAISQFVDEHVIPLEPLLLSQQWSELNSALSRIRKKVKYQNWWPTHPELKPMPLYHMGLLSEIVGRSPLGHYAFGFQAPDIGNMELLEQFGSAELKNKWLRPLKLGDIRSCFAMTEPNNPGSNPTLLSTTAEIKNDQWVINGHKWFTTSADGAQFMIVMAITDPSAPKHLRASMILVPADTPGMKLIRNIPVMGHSGHGYFSHGEIEFKDCHIPVNNLIGKAGQGFKLAQHRLGPGRIHHCMRWIGVANRCFDLMCKHVKNRQITDQQVLADQALIQAKVADAYTSIQAARALVLNTAKHIDDTNFEATRFNISMIKFHCADMLQKVINHSLQCLGSAGMSDDHIIAYFYREERAATIYDGPNEVHQLSLAKQILKSY